MPRHETGASASIEEAWRIRGGLRVWVGGHNVDARRNVETYLGNTERPPTGSVDLGLIAPATGDEAVYFARKLRPRLVADAALWIVYPNPRGSGGEAFAAQFDEMIIGLFEAGFAETGRMAFSDSFSMIGFRPDRKSDTL